MGRYYSGDIEGKFWFGIQSSNDADFFGQQGQEPSHLTYYYDKDDLPQIKSGIKECKKHLGQNKKKIDDFFKERSSYNDTQLAKHLELDDLQTKTLLQWYARLRLGEKIRKCVEKEGDCSFDAEL